MNLNELATIIAKSAPLLANALGSPLAGIAASLISQVIGVDSNNVQDMVNKINANPELLIKIKELEYKHEEEFKRISASNYQTEVDDRKSARLREISLHDYVPTVLAVGFLVNYALIQFYCVMHANSANDIISARFQDVLIMIVSYYFGSSHSGKPPPAKDNLQNDGWHK